MVEILKREPSACMGQYKKGMEVFMDTLTYVDYSESMKFNLCKLSRVMKNRRKMCGDEKGIKTSKNRKHLMFDLVVRTVTLSASVTNTHACCITKAHVWLGHPNIDATR